jgi:transposase-like protein
MEAEIFAEVGAARGEVAAQARSAHRNGYRSRAWETTVGEKRLHAVAPKVCGCLAEAEEDLIAFYGFPAEHWSKLRSTNPLERVNKEIGRRSDVVGIFPKDAAVIRLVGALLIERNDEWLVSRRYVSVESMVALLADEALHADRARPDTQTIEDGEEEEVAALEAG